MDKEAFEKYLKERYYDQMEYYDRKSGFYQKRYKKFQWILIILSAVTPVLAALDGNEIFKYGGMVYKFDLNIVVVIISAVVAILTSGLKTFQYQELWVSYRVTQELLKPEIYYYQFSINGYESIENKEAIFVKRIEAILDTEHKGWPASKKLEENGGKGEQTVVDADKIKGITPNGNAGAGAGDNSNAGAGAGASAGAGDDSGAGDGSSAGAGDSSGADAGAGDGSGIGDDASGGAK